MSKDDKLEQLDDVAAYEASLNDEYKEEEVARPVKKQPVQNVKSDKAKKKAPGRFKRFFIKIGKKLKETFAELKKVTWPKFPKVMKQTGIVLTVVAFFLIVVFAFDLGLSQLYHFLMSKF